LDQIAVFLAVVETGSFSKAAREFATTQPTVTKQIAATEAQLGEGFEPFGTGSGIKRHPLNQRQYPGTAFQRRCRH